MSETDYAAALTGFGLPADFAAMIAGRGTGAAAGALFDNGRQLSALIGRPTPPLAESVKAVLA